MTIRTLALSAPLLVLPFAIQAEPLWWGQAELEFGQTSYSNLAGNAEGAVFDRSPLSGRVSGKLGADFGQFGLQLDLSASADDVPADEYTGYTAGTFAALHARYDISPALSVGAFGGAGRASTADWNSADLRFAGLEGRYDFGAWVLTAGVGKFDSNDETGTDAFYDGQFARLGVMTEFGDAIVEGSLASFSGKQDSSGGYDMEGYGWSVKYSRPFDALPMAWTVGLEGGQFSNGTGSDSGSFDSARLTLGLTAWFGSEGLAQSKRRAFDTPDFARVVHSGYFVD